MGIIATLLNCQLTDKQEALAQELLLAHSKATVNTENLSKHVYANATFGSSNPMNGVAAALMSTGGPHAPVSYTRNALFTSPELGLAILDEQGAKLPGFGNNFFKHGTDPSFFKVWDMLEKTQERKTLDIWQKRLEDARGKHLYPNAAGITAAVAEHLKVVSPLENWFFIAGRSSAWLQITF